MCLWDPSNGASFEHQSFANQCRCNLDMGDRNSTIVEWCCALHSLSPFEISFWWHLVACNWIPKCITMQSKLTKTKKMMQQRHTQRDYALILLQVYRKGYSFWRYCVMEIQFFSYYYYLSISFPHVLNFLNIILISWWHGILTLYICLNF